MNTEPKKLMRTESDKMLGGVCGGFAKYLDIDPTLVRIGVVVLALFTGVGILAYLLAWMVIPSDGGTNNPNVTAFPSYRPDANRSPLDDIYGERPGTHNDAARAPYQGADRPADRPFEG